MILIVFGRSHHRVIECSVCVKDCRSATDAMHRLQGARLSADHSGIRIEYARNKIIDLVGIKLT